MAITISIDNDRVAAGTQPLIEDESSGTNAPLSTDTGNEIDVTLSGGLLGGFLTAFNTFLNGNIFGAFTLTNAQKTFAAANDGASSSADFVKVTVTAGETISNLLFSDSAGNALDGDQVFTSPGVPLTTLDGSNVYLWSNGDFAIATTSATSGAGRIVAAFYLNDADPNHLQAQVQTVTFEPLSHPNATNPDDAVNWTDVLQVSAQGTLSFNFDNLDSGSFLWAAVGSSTAGIMVTGQDLNVNDNAGASLGDIVTGGQGGDPSDTVNTSQGGLGATIGINSQHFTDASDKGNRIDGAVGVFTLVKGFVPLASATQAHGINVNQVDYTDYINAPSAKIFISQATGSSSIGGAMRVTLWEAGGGSSADHATSALKPEEGYADVAGGSQSYIGNQDTDSHLRDDTPVAVGSVTVQRGASTFTFTGSGGVQSGITVAISANGFTVSGLIAHDTVGFAAADNPNTLLDGTFNRFDVQVLANSNPIDIGRIDLDQGVALPHAIGDQILVQDDGPVLSGTTVTKAVGEDALSGVAPDLSTGNADSGDTKTDKVSYSYADIAGIVTVGTDSPAITSLVSSFAANTAVKDIDGNAITSGGDAVFWAVSGGVVQGVTAANRVIFTITNDSANSEYDVDLNDQIDHHDSLGAPLGDEGVTTLNLTPAFKVTDKDLDPATLTGNLVKLDVENDIPIQNNALVAGTVDEDGVIENIAAGTQTGDGIAGGTGDVAGIAVTATGSIAPLFTVGADEPLAYGLSATTSGLPSLTSGGVAVAYSVSGNTLTAYLTGGNPATQADQVFTFTITNTSTGAYSFTLIDQLDHASLDGLTGDNEENDLLIQLGSILQATDKDGDKITYVPAGDNSNGLVITVDDDTPTQNSALVAGTVDEDGVIENIAAGTQTGDGIAGGTGDVAGEAVTATGNIASLFNSGADEPLVYGLSATTSGLPSLSSGGVAVAYSVSGNTLTAYLTGGNPATQADQVFTFTITNTSTGAYSFTLIDQLDHASLDGLTGDDTENDLLIQLGSILQATDKDGDTITYVPAGDNTNGLVITVDDDTPTQNSALVAGTVDEDGVIEDVAAGTQTGDGIAGGTGDVAGEAVTATGNIASLFNSGADEPLVYGLSATTSGLPSLSSGGVAVAYSVSGNTLTAYLTGGNPATPADQVFTFSITNTSTGAYSFTLIDQLDHASLDGLTGDDTENDLLIQLGSILQATDKDGDTITYVPAGDNSNGLVITVDDDTPTAKANATATKEVQEDALSGGNTPDAGDAETKSVTATYTNADLNSLVNSGADANMSFALNTAASGAAGAVIGTNVVTTGDVAVKSGGVNVTWAAGATPGSLAGITTVGAVVTTIFTLVPSGSSFVFTLADQVDHSGAENDLELLGIDLTKAFIGNDFDHDAVTFNADSIVMNVENDLPVFTAQVASKTLDWVQNNSFTSTLNGKVGADDSASYIIDKFTDLAGYTETLSGDGKTLTYSQGGTTFFTLALSDSANSGAGSYTFTVNQPPPQSVTHFSFLDMPSGQNLQAVIAKDKTNIDTHGTATTADDTLPDGGILVMPTNPVLKADGTYSNASGTINTSQGGGNVTIGNGNQAFDKAGDGAWFVFVDNPLKADVGGYPSGAGGIDQNTADDADTIGFTGFIESHDSSVKIVQASGGGKQPGPEMHITAYEGHEASVSGTTQDRAFVNDPTAANISGGNAVADEVNIVGVKIKDAGGTVIEYRTLNQATGVADLAPGSADSPVTIRFNLDNAKGAGTADDIYSAFVGNLQANYTVEFLTTDNHNMAKVEWVSGSFDIGGFDLVQGNDTADVDFQFSVAIQDKDADLMHWAGSSDVFDDFKIKVDGTGVNNDPNNVAPTGFSTSYDSVSDFL